jgi:hypothetical protein
MHLTAQFRPDGDAVETFTADHDESCFAPLAGKPGAVEIMLDPVADRLQDTPAAATDHIGKTLDPQHIMRGDHRAQSGKEGITRLYWAACDDKAFEIVVIVLAFQIVEGWPGREIFLGCGGKAQRNLRDDLSISCCDKLDPGPKLHLDFPAKCR